MKSKSRKNLSKICLAQSRSAKAKFAFGQKKILTWAKREARPEARPHGAGRRREGGSHVARDRGTVTVTRERSRAERPSEIDMR